MIEVFAETAEALDQWEPRLKLRRVDVSEASAGRLHLVLTGEVQGATTALELELGA